MAAHGCPLWRGNSYHHCSSHFIVLPLYSTHSLHLPCHSPHPRPPHTLASLLSRLDAIESGHFLDMPPAKRRLSTCDDDTAASTKRRRQTKDTAPSPPAQDAISGISDELLVRILSYMDEHTLLSMALVSKRFHAIASDSQLWRPHYYRRFILPRAHRIPGFKAAARKSSSDPQCSSNGIVPAPNSNPAWKRPASTTRWNAMQDQAIDRVDWKKQYRLRHNWARGRCAVEQVEVHEPAEEAKAVSTIPSWQTLVKVVEGIAVTVDSVSGLRAWDLRTRQPIAQVHLEPDHVVRLRPSCLAIDDAHLHNGQVDVAVGFQDGTAGVWRLDAHRNTLRLLFRQEKSFLGSLVAIAYHYPYLMTATKPGFIALYTFNNPSTDDTSDHGDDTDAETRRDSTPNPANIHDDEHTTLPPPYLLTSLKSQNTEKGLALSIRKHASSIVASIAYTVKTLGGWSIGIQDLNVRPSGAVTSRVATSLPTQTRFSSTAPSSLSHLPTPPSSWFANDQDDETFPIALRYSHPYILATLPDNTLMLHLCTSTATSLSISSGVRLWGHTSGISDAEITPRGKAVSVSTRGDEIRVWELEGRVGGRSVEVRPRQQQDGELASPRTSLGSEGASWRDDQRQNWVGFDDEVVLVLKEARDGRDSLMLYDFT